MVQQQIAVDLQRRVSIQGLSRAIVNFISNRIELVLAVARQICALRQVLAHQAVGVLVRSALPRTVRVTEIDGDVRVGLQLLVARHLPALIMRERLDASAGQSSEAFA